MKNISWYAPKLKEYALDDIVKMISIKASSGMCEYNVLSEGEGSVACGGFPEGSGGDISFCLELGPLAGCDEYGILSCSSSTTPILSNDDEIII